MIKENRTSKYLLYAIGEIVLVVIGILIALSINNWNENRKDRKLETQALINLKAEFNENQRRLESLIKIKQEQEDEGRAFLEIITNDSIPLSQKINTKPPRQYLGTWSATNAVLNSLLSTGEITNIKNDSLKFLLTNWSVKVAKFKDVENRHSNAINEKNAYLKRRVYKGIVKPGDHGDKWPGRYFPNNIDSKIDSQKAKYINDIQYYNLTNHIISRLYIQLMTAKEIQDDYYKISRLIDLELKNRKIDFNEKQ
ncbi:hypothetical protein JYT34_00675 [Olleya sp. AH-315-K02]|nr:hypothetical protein [Olleya sp. AH-315-K02]